MVLPLLVGIGFQVLFHSPSGVLFTFPSRYLCTIGHRIVFSLRRWSSRIPTGFLVSRSTWEFDKGSLIYFFYRTFTFYGQPFQTVQIYIRFVTSLPIRNWVQSNPTTPCIQRFRALTNTWFGLFPVRSPLLWKSLLFSLPEVTKMFQFTSLASAAYVFSYRCLGINQDGFPHSEISGSKFV